MNNKKKKKQNGFTIVELVIVIAVIGILAAVLIPTFSNLVKKSKQSADQQLVYHINEAVIANEVDNLAKGKSGTEATMYDTLKKLESDYGFTVEKMTPRSGNDIVWDSTTNRFALVAKDNTVIYTDSNRPSDMTNKAQMWRITEAGETLGDGYSHYLTAGWSGTESVTVATGVDVGENDDITAVTYDSSSDASAVVRTNGGTLTVKAPNGTVNHYGEAESVNVVAVANNSYHENGTVKFVEISKGRIALETGAEVSHIHINAKVVNDVKQDEFDNIIIAKANDVTMPEFSRDDVEIATAGTLVVALQTGTEEVTSQTKLDYVWLTKQGVYEQITVSNSDTNAGTTWVNTSNKPAETKTAAQQIANNIGTTATVGSNTYDVAVDETTRDIVLKETGTDTVVYTVTVEEGKTVVTTTGENPTTVEVEVVEAQPDKDTLQTIALLFDGGKGTENDPYLIPTFNALLNVDAVATGSETLYYRVVENLVAYDTTDWATGNLYKDPATYVIDMNGHSLTVKNAYIFGYAVNLELYNGTINYVGSGSVVGYACYQDMSSYNIYFHNLVLTGEYETSNSHYGPLVSYAFGINSGNASLNASNIVNNLTINNKNSDGYTGGLFGYVQGSAISSSITNCTFNGTIVSAHAAPFINTCSAPNAGVTSENNIFNGRLLATKDVHLFGCNGNVTGGSNTLTALANSVTEGSSAVKTVVAPSTTLIYVSENNEVVLNRENGVENYRIAIVFSVNKDDDGTGGYPRFITVDLNQFEEESVNTGLYKVAIHQESADLSSGKTVVVNQNGTLIWMDTDGYHVYQPGYSLSNSKATIYAYGYADGNIVAYQAIAYNY